MSIRKETVDLFLKMYQEIQRREGFDFNTVEVLTTPPGDYKEQVLMGISFHGNTAMDNERHPNELPHYNLYIDSGDYAIYIACVNTGDTEELVNLKALLNYLDIKVRDKEIHHTIAKAISDMYELIESVGDYLSNNYEGCDYNHVEQFIEDLEGMKTSIEGFQVIEGL